LTSKERGAIQKAAEAEGYSESFTDLLCRFAELIGTDEVLRELARIVASDPKIVAGDPKVDAGDPKE
jgi:ATP phosphoribosyltransferase regulatory subunit HisZ